MGQVDQALGTVANWLRALLGLFLGLFGVLDVFLRHALARAGVPGSAQAAIILVAAVVFIAAVLRLFGGVFRILLVVFLILLMLHVLLPPNSF